MTKKLTLVCTVGMSPEVITETIYAIKQDFNRVPDELHFLTTSQGRKLIQEFKQEKSFVWDALRESLGATSHDLIIDEAKIHVAKKKDGTVLDDLQDTEANLLDAELIHSVIGQLSEDQNRLIFACLAGGRKTMSSHMLSAMQLYGRKDDKVLHILLDSKYNGIKNFYFPDQPSDPRIPVTQDKKGTTLKINPSDVNPSLIEVPFVKIGGLIDSLRNELQQNSYTSLIDRANQLIDAMVTKPFQHGRIYIKEEILSFDYLGTLYDQKLEPRQLQLVLFHHIWNEYHNGVEQFQLIDLNIDSNFNAQNMSWLIVYELCYSVFTNKSLKIRDFVTLVDDYVKQRSYLKKIISKPNPKNLEAIFYHSGSDRSLATNIFYVYPVKIIWEKDLSGRYFKRFSNDDSTFVSTVTDILAKYSRNFKKNDEQHILIKNKLLDRNTSLEVATLLRSILKPLFEID